MYTRHVADRSDRRTFGTKYAPWPIVTLVLYRRSSGRRAETRARDDDGTLYTRAPRFAPRSPARYVYNMGLAARQPAVSANTPYIVKLLF